MTLTQEHSFAVAGFGLTGMDEFGCLWTVRPEIDGWFVGADVRTATQPRSQQSGAWRGKSYRGGRVFTLRGLVRCPDWMAMEQAGRRLSAVLAGGGFGEFIGSSAAGTFSSTVQLEEAPKFDALSADTAAWQLVLGSEDPLLYGPPTVASTTLAGSGAGTGRTWARKWSRAWGVAAGVTPGAVTIANAGKATYWPTLRIYGPVTSPTIRVQETGDSLTFNGTIPAGQWLDIDAGGRHVTFGANEDDVRYLTDVTGRWLAVPPGGATFTYEADTADAAAALYLYGYEGAWD